jgi:hypothetical protein
MDRLVGQTMDTTTRIPPHRIDPPPQPSPRTYYCRGCGVEDKGHYVPRGWYSTRRHLGEGGNGAIRLGLFCSLPCLLAALTKLARGTQPLGPIGE